ncbi:relaxase/mobilization nuclease domain-containing protein [Azospirillum melinis]
MHHQTRAAARPPRRLAAGQRRGGPGCGECRAERRPHAVHAAWHPTDRVETAAWRWAHDTFAGTHDWVMVRHDDTGHPHVHIAVRAVGADGRRLAPGPADLQHWRERFALELRRLGVVAEATPRAARSRLRNTAPQPPTRRASTALCHTQPTPAPRRHHQR